MENLAQYVVDEALILVPVLWILGKLLKSSSIADKYIVWVLLGVGVLLAVALLGISAESVVQGVLITGTAVLGHQLVKQSAE